MMAPAATSRPSSVRRRALTPRRGGGRRGTQGQDRHCGEPTGAATGGGGAGDRVRPGPAGRPPARGYHGATMTRRRAARAAAGRRGHDRPVGGAGRRRRAVRGPARAGRTGRARARRRRRRRRRGPVRRRTARPGPRRPGRAGARRGAASQSTERFANRELSWLEFADRLLDLADDERQPLLERVKFLAIFAEGLDEFFQVRVAGLEDQVAAGLRTRSPDGLSPGEQLPPSPRG